MYLLTNREIIGRFAYESERHSLRFATCIHLQLLRLLLCITDSSVATIYYCARKYKKITYILYLKQP